MKKNKKGTSLVSVVVAFLLLEMILLLFQKSLQLANQLVIRSVDVRQEVSELTGAYYLNRQDPSETRELVCQFQGEDGGFTLTTKWSTYTQSAGSLYYFGDGTLGSTEDTGGGS